MFQGIRMKKYTRPIDHQCEVFPDSENGGWMRLTQICITPLYEILFNSMHFISKDGYQIQTTDRYPIIRLYE